MTDPKDLIASVPKAWQFTGPFSMALYQSIHNQAAVQDNLTGKNAPAVPSKYASKYGVRSRFPRSSPKYARYFQLRHHEFLETTARMYIRVANPQAFVNEFSYDQVLKAIARVLVGYQDEHGITSGGRGYIDFFLQQANHSMNEKVQIAEVLSDNYVAFFFGQSAPIFRYAGSLMNTFQDDWTINMLRMYQSISRGSQLARRGVMFYLKYDSVVVVGSPLNFSYTLTGDTEIVAPFSFDFLVRKIHILYNGLEPPTDFTMDSQIELVDSASFFPMSYNPSETSKKQTQGMVHDNLMTDTTYGAGGADYTSGKPPGASDTDATGANKEDTGNLGQVTTNPEDKTVVPYEQQSNTVLNPTTGVYHPGIGPKI